MLVGGVEGGGGNNYLGSAFLWTWALRCHMMLCLGRKRDTHMAMSCQPCMNTDMCVGKRRGGVIFTWGPRSSGDGPWGATWCSVWVGRETHTWPWATNVHRCWGGGWGNNYLGSAFLWRWALRCHMMLCLGRKRDTHMAMSCQPCMNTDVGGGGGG